MGVNIGLDFGTSNSGVAIYDGQNVKLLPIDPGNVVPEVTRTILYITRNYQYFIGQEAIELYYRHNVDRLRRYVKKWAGEIEYRGADMYYVRDVYVDVDELQPGRLLQYLKTALRKQDNNQTYRGTQIFERYYQLVDLLQIYLVTLKHRAEVILELVRVRRRHLFHLAPLVDSTLVAIEDIEGARRGRVPSADHHEVAIDAHGSPELVVC